MKARDPFAWYSIEAVKIARYNHFSVALNNTRENGCVGAETGNKTRIRRTLAEGVEGDQ